MSFSPDDEKVPASQGRGCQHPGSVDPGLVGDYQNFVWPKSVLELAMECHEVPRSVSKCQIHEVPWSVSKCQISWCQCISKMRRNNSFQPGLLNLMLFIFFGTLYIQNNYGKIKICYECLKSLLCSEDHAIPLDLTGYNTKSYTLLSTFLCYNNTVLIPKLISYSRFRQENQGTEAGWREGHCVYEPQS